MPKFLKLFRRKKGDPAAAGILSPSAQASPGASSGPNNQTKKKKKEKKLSKRQLKKQKKKDKLAGFPTSGDGRPGDENAGGNAGNTYGGGVTGGAAAGINKVANGAVPAAPAWEGPEAQKENSPAPRRMVASAPPPPPPSSLPQARTWRAGPPAPIDTGSFGGDNNHVPYSANHNHNNNNNDHPARSPQYEGAADFYEGDIYEKPMLSIISEETKSPRSQHSTVASLASPRNAAPVVVSPKNAVMSPTSAVSGLSGGGASNGGVSHASGVSGGSPANQTVRSGSQASGNPHNTVSPMGRSKPPLTPNRLGGRGSAGGGSIGSSRDGSVPSSGANGHYALPGRHAAAGGNRPASPMNGMTVDTGGAGNIIQLSMSSDDQSLRGTHFAGSEDQSPMGTHFAGASAGDDMMCFSADDDEDEAYDPPPPTAGRGSSREAAVNPGNSAALGDNGKEKFVSALDRGGPFGYGGEQEDGDALFPALVDDRDPWGHGGGGGGGGAATASEDRSAEAPAPEGGLSILPMAHETQEDMRAWTPSPTKHKAFTFQGDKVATGGGHPNHGPKGAAGGGGAGGGPNANSKPIFENFPTSAAGNGGAGGPNGNSEPIFENFADFEPFDPAASANGQFHDAKRDRGGSKSVHGGSSPVSSLLEESKARRRQRSGQRSVEGSSPVHNFPPRTIGGGGGGGGSSFQSAPVLTPSHIRGQVRAARSHKGGADSISRVIDNLELHVNKHKAESSPGCGGGAAARDAKERLRRENLMQSESKMIDLLAAGSPAGGATPRTGDGDDWLFDSVADTLGPRAANADLESIDGRSHRSGRSGRSLGGKSHRSGRSHRSHMSKKSRSERSSRGGGHRRHRSRHVDDGMSVDSRASRASRNSYRSYQTTKSMVSQMSEQSRSVANDLLRLEAQLSMVGKSREKRAAAACGGAGGSSGGGPPTTLAAGDAGRSGGASVASRSERHKRRDDCGMTVTSRDYSLSRGSRGSVSRSSAGIPRRHHGGKSSSSSRNHISASARRAAVRTMRSKVTVVAPPGKLGIILANRTDQRGTVVSGVRTSSVLADQVSPGDRIVAIDDEDVGQMNVKEITTIMARKSEFERVLVLLAAPKVTYD